MALDGYPDRLPGDNGTALAVVPTVDSTNQLARRVAGDCRASGGRVPRLVIAALRQTAGRGRRGRPWLSPPGGLYLSLLLPIPAREVLQKLPLAVPLALCAALAEPTAGRCRIKWPNDLVVEGRKLGGVLIEALAGEGGVVIGIGINCAQAGSDLPGPWAVSLAQLDSPAPAPETLGPQLAAAVLSEIDAGRSSAELVDRYRRVSLHRQGDEIQWHDGRRLLTGIFQGFDLEGRLRLQTEHGPLLVATGELIDDEEPKGPG